MDAGVPISSPAAGVAVGLVSKNNTQNDQGFQLGQHEVMVDILGMEDFLGQVVHILELELRLVRRHADLELLRDVLRIGFDHSAGVWLRCLPSEFIGIVG